MFIVCLFFYFTPEKQQPKDFNNKEKKKHIKIAFNK